MRSGGLPARRISTAEWISFGGNIIFPDFTVDGERGKPGILQQPQSRTTCIFTGRHDRDDRSGRYVRRMLPALYSGTRHGRTWHDGTGRDAACCKCGGINRHDTTRSAARDAGAGGDTGISCVIGNFIPITQKSSAGMRTSR